MRRKKSSDFNRLNHIYLLPGPELFQKTFVSWLEERKELADMVEKGIRVWEEMTFFSLNMTLPA